MGDQPGWLERAWSNVAAPWAARRQLRLRRLEELPAIVAEQGQGLRPLSEAALDERVSELRAALHRSALDVPLLGRAFAIVQEVAGRTLGMRHYDSQLMGGFVMMQGMVAEMETGEGKTLTATLPACTAALAGIPVHVVTVNDYLVARDAELMGPVYQALGLRVGTVTEEQNQPEQRRAAYGCDVTYCTNKQLTFDYLRDRLVLSNRRGRLGLSVERLHESSSRLQRVMLRGLCFAIVDEADSVLIDEARTPLVISKEGDASGEQEVYREALELAGGLAQGKDFALHAGDRVVELTTRGRERLSDLAADRHGVWKAERRRVELVTQALSALHVFRRDDDYLVRDGKVQIVDAHTGRIMADRSWERGLHQMVETKEGCELTGRKETLARITYQRFFRRYLRLAGMSGTVQEVRRELRSVYGLEVVRVPTHAPVQRRSLPDRIHETSEERWRDVVERIAARSRAGQPVLVGTRSVAASELLANLLREAGLPHQLLNARQDAEEAAIVARAGEAGRITVATNMAGRGTDIALGPGVTQKGGLHVISTERNDSRRVDRQLFGRCGRQGDPGSHEALLSLSDEVLKRQFPRGLPWFLRALRELGPSPRRWLDKTLMWGAQFAVERRHRQMRRELLKQDERLGSALAFSGPQE